jgi:hypothetical protein
MRCFTIELHRQKKATSIFQYYKGSSENRVAIFFAVLGAAKLFSEMGLNDIA